MNKIEKLEKTINDILLKIILWFSFLLDSKDNINDFIQKHKIGIKDHLIEQYQKAKKYYKAFKKRHKEYTNSQK